MPGAAQRPSGTAPPGGREEQVHGRGAAGGGGEGRRRRRGGHPLGAGGRFQKRLLQGQCPWEERGARRPARGVAGGAGSRAAGGVQGAGTGHLCRRTRDPGLAADLRGAQRGRGADGKHGAPVL